MTLTTPARRGRKAAIALAGASLVAGGALSITGLSTAGGAPAAGDRTTAGWPAASAAGSPAATAAAVRGADLVVRTVEVRAAEVDLAPRGESPGDFFHFEEVAYKPGTHRVVGRDAVRCELGIRSFSCTGTIRINGKGKIVIDGALFSGSDLTFAITGGTGRYAGVGGTLRPIEGPGGSTLLVFDFAHHHQH